jgi:hypothetical protein
MTRSFRTATTGLAVALMLTGITASAHGFMGLSPWQPGIPGRLIQLRGTVVCTGCSLTEARRLQHDKYGNHLYQVTSRQGQLVLDIHAVSNPRWFDYVTLPQISLRGEEGLLQPLSAPEIQSKDVELTGLLTNPRTLDVSAVVIQVSTPPTLDVSEMQIRQ